DRAIKLLRNQPDCAAAGVDLGKNQLIGTHDTSRRRDISTANFATADNAFPPKTDGDFIVLGVRHAHGRLAGSAEHIPQCNFRPPSHPCTSATSASISLSRRNTSSSPARIAATRSL